MKLIKRFCLKCGKPFKTEEKTNDWGMPLSDTLCPSCRAVSDHYKEMGKKSAVARQKKILAGLKPKVAKQK